MHESSLVTSSSDAPDMVTVTCVVWSPSGRHVALGTPGGLLLYSVESLLSAAAAAAPHAAGLLEVGRCLLPGGVRLVSLYGQCSVVAVAGVAPGVASMRVRLVDVSCSAILAEATFPSDVAAVYLSPVLLAVALAGEAPMVGSNRLYLFDHRLQQRHCLDIFPPSRTAFLRDTMAMAAAWTPAYGAGMSIERLRMLLPGERRGEVRLLSLKRVARGGGASSSRDDHPDGEAEEEETTTTTTAFLLGAKVLHQSPLRAVAVAADGRRGVTMGESGTKLHVIEFLDDHLIVTRWTLERGRSRAVVDDVSLGLRALPHLPGDLVVCITRTGTLHLFLCDSTRQRVTSLRDKTLCPRGAGLPFAFALALPEAAAAAAAGHPLLVLQWDVAPGGAPPRVGEAVRVLHFHLTTADAETSVAGRLRLRLCGAHYVAP